MGMNSATNSEDHEGITGDIEAETHGAEAKTGAASSDNSDVTTYTHFLSSQPPNPKRSNNLKMPTLDQLLQSKFVDRQYLLSPWLREQESCMVYADTGVGKSMFALSASIAVAGGGEFLGWKPDRRTSGEAWKVLYVDGEMHIGDIQDRARMLLDAVPGVDRARVGANLRFLARQHQEPDVAFPLITERAGTEFILERVRKGPLDLVVLDNFSTLGEVEDENAASSFTSIQQFLLQLKVQGVATMLVHHAGKPQGSKAPVTYRGSSKLAATFETIIQLERLQEKGEAEPTGAQFTVRWDKVRAGGPTRQVRGVAAKLVTKNVGFAEQLTAWEDEFCNGTIAPEEPKLRCLRAVLM
jgi:AAA domain